MVIDSLNLKLRQIARFSSNVISNEMPFAKYRLFLLICLCFWLLNTKKDHFTTCTSGNFSFQIFFNVKFLKCGILFHILV